MDTFEYIAVTVLLLLSFLGGIHVGSDQGMTKIQAKEIIIYQKDQEIIKLKHKIEVLEIKAQLEQANQRLRQIPSRHFVRSSYYATAYTHTGNRTATGTYPKAGRTIAVDRKKIPLGSKVKVTCPDLPKYNGVYKAEDTGGKIKGKIIDIFTDTRSEAINFGRRKVKVEVIQ